MILKIKSDLKNQIEENINVHKNIFKISEDIIEVIENIYKKLKKVENYYFVEMVVQLQTHNIWQLNLLSG